MPRRARRQIMAHLLRARRRALIVLAVPAVALAIVAVRLAWKLTAPLREGNPEKFWGMLIALGLGAAYAGWRTRSAWSRRSDADS
jgi:hypothetical protein